MSVNRSPFSEGEDPMPAGPNQCTVGGLRDFHNKRIRTLAVQEEINPMKRWFVFGPALAAAMMISNVGCSRQIPQGHVGKVLTSSGWDDRISGPGHVSCWGRDELYLLAAGDYSRAERLNVLCADQLNFRCDLAVVCRPKSDEASRNAIFLRVEAETGTEACRSIRGEQLYDVYIKPVVVPAAYEIVSLRNTAEIGGQLGEIKREIVQLCRQRMGPDAPVELALVDVTNTDYPEALTQANEARKKKEIELEIARAEAAIECLRSESRLRAAIARYLARQLETQLGADLSQLATEDHLATSLVLPSPANDR